MIVESIVDDNKNILTVGIKKLTESSSILTINNQKTLLPMFFFGTCPKIYYGVLKLVVLCVFVVVFES